MIHTPMCPVCGVIAGKQIVLLDDDNDNPSPAEGDLVCCGFCLAFVVYTEGGKAARALTADELKNLPDNMRAVLYNAREHFKQHPLPDVAEYEKGVTRQ